MFIAQLNQPNDNSANIRLGGEYAFHELFFFRAGYKINVDDQPWPTTGIGIRTRLGRHPVRLNYGVDPMPYLGIQHRIGLSLQVNSASRTDAPDSSQDSAN